MFDRPYLALYGYLCHQIDIHSQNSSAMNLLNGGARSLLPDYTWALGLRLCSAQLTLCRLSVGKSQVGLRPNIDIILQ